MKKTVRVLLFAALRETLNMKELKLEIDSLTCVAELLDKLKSSYPSGATLFSLARVAVNQRMVSVQQELSDGDEIALLLPTSGG